MTRVDELVQDFLGQRRIAVVGVSDRRETGCNAVYKRFRDSGYTVYPVNPRLRTYEGQPCYPDLSSIPERPDGVFILARPAITEQFVGECVRLGIRRVWMHCLMGTLPGLSKSTTSVSQPAADMCRANGISVIPGSCPNQFLNPDPGHAIMRRLWRLLGFLRVA